MAHPYGAGDRPLQRAERALYEIEVSWEFMTHEDFNPVALALQLMDGTLPGRSYSEFTQYFHKLDDSLTDIVDEYYQGFNNSILSFSEIKDKLADTQYSIQQVQESIQTTHQSLAHDKSALGQLYYKVTQHTEMIRVLDQIEALKAISEEIEELTSKKQYLLAVEKLLEGLKVINSPEMRQVGALTDLRAQVTKEKNEIHEVIIEELHNHVYLKSPYCERKMALAYDDDASGGLGKLGGADVLAKGGKRGQRTAKPVEDEDNPEVNSFDYVEMLIQSLVLLGRIDDSVTRIQERIPVELNHLTNRVITEVEERHRIGTESEAPLANGAANTASVTTTVATTKPPLTGQQRLQDQEVLEDFVSTLYVRFGSVLEYHRFVLEVIGRVSKRQSGQERPALTTRGLSPTYALREVWLSIQSEIKSMLYDYLTTDTKVAQDSDTSTSPLSAAMGNPTASPSAPLSIGGSLLGRDRSARRGSTSLRNQGARWLEEWNLIKNRAATSPGSPSAVGSPGNRNSRIEGKQVFNFSQSEMKATSEALYKPIGDDVRQLLNGLHPESATQRATNSTAVDRFADSDNSARHPMLVTPSIYHASVVLTPTIRFLSKIGHVLLESRDTQEFDEFLRHFFVRFFLPQVEAYAMQLFHHITVGTDAFYNHPTLMFRGRPVVKSAVAIVPLIHDLSGMLSAIPFYREEYVMIIEKLIRKYFEECQTRFREATACSKGHPSATHSFKNALTASTVSLPPLPTDEPMPDVPLLSSSQHHHHNANQQCISARWAKDDDLLQLLDMKLRLLLHEHDVTYDPHADRELEIEYRLKHDRSIHPSELMFDVKKMNFLATLYHSLEWFLLNVKYAKTTSKGQGASSHGADHTGRRRSRQTSDLTDARRHVSRLPSGETAGHSSSTGSDDSDSDEPRLDLDLLAQMQGLREKLDELWNQHRALATSCLVILRIEIRCRCMYYLELTTREGNYGLDAETGEPDQYIQTFNADLIMCEELLAKSLPRDELEFIFSGISYLIANILVTNATRLKDLNRFGVHKMVRNILALQQNLTNISLCSELGMDRALKYYKLFEMNAEAIIQHIHDQGVLFTYDQYKFILDKVYTMTEHATLNTDNYEAEYRKYKASIVELEALFKQPTAMEALASSS